MDTTKVCTEKDSKLYDTIVSHLKWLYTRQQNINKKNQELAQQIKHNESVRKALDNIVNELTATTTPENTLTRLYRKGDLTPPCNTDQELRDAYWKYYSDENISTFGSNLSPYLACVWLSEDPSMKALCDKFKAVCPKGYHPVDSPDVHWTREHVKNVVELVPRHELINIGY